MNWIYLWKNTMLYNKLIGRNTLEMIDIKENIVPLKILDVNVDFINTVSTIRKLMPVDLKNEHHLFCKKVLG